MCYERSVRRSTMKALPRVSTSTRARTTISIPPRCARPPTSAGKGPEVLPPLRHAQGAGNQTPQTGTQFLREHLAIIDAIEKRDAGEAEHIARSHVEELLKRISTDSQINGLDDSHKRNCLHTRREARRAWRSLIDDAKVIDPTEAWSRLHHPLSEVAAPVQVADIVDMGDRATGSGFAA